MLIKSATLLTILSACSMLNAQDQKGYHVFNPTPKEMMREFSIDRPDITESPITVDAGHFQMEADLIKWKKDNQRKANQTTSVMSALYKMGLTHSWDIHIGIEPYNIYKDPEGRTMDKGYGTTTIRLKHNFWGNDIHTRTGFGVIPYAVFLSGNPLDSEVNYGVGFPFFYALNDQLDLSVQPQIDFLLTENGNHNLGYLQTIALGGTMTGDFDFFIEGLAIFSEDNKQLLIDYGIIYDIFPNLKIDIAANQGINEEAPTRVYLGFSFRI